VDDLLGSFRWYDALCINQNDEQERGHQVEMMGEIYKMAYWVLAWLGTPDFREPHDKIDIIGHQTASKPVLAFDFLELHPREERIDSL
jgi:hypothetical protein